MFSYIKLLLSIYFSRGRQHGAPFLRAENLGSLSTTWGDLSGKALRPWFSVFGSNGPFTGVTYQIFTLQFITVANYSYKVAMKNNFMIGGHRNMKNCIKGLQH